MRLGIQRWVRILWVAFLVFWVLAALIQKQTLRRESRATRVLQLSLVALALVVLTNPKLGVGLLGVSFVPKGFFFPLLGLTFDVAGLAFAIWARFILGRNWSPAVSVKQDHELVRRGPYALVRHPIYTGILLAILGTAIAIREVRGLLAFGVVALALWIKSRREEAFMTEQFGAAYSQYKDEVKAIIPFLW